MFCCKTMLSENNAGSRTSARALNTKAKAAAEARVCEIVLEFMPLSRAQLPGDVNRKQMVEVSADSPATTARPRLLEK